MNLIIKPDTFLRTNFLNFMKAHRGIENAVPHRESVFRHPEKIFDINNGMTLCKNHHIPTYARIK